MQTHDDNSFFHQALDLTTDEIRLLKIDDDSSPSRISLTLSHGHISQLKYSCVSYAWGNEHPLHTIWMRQPGESEQKPISIRSNLFDFLEAARRSDIKEWLWIDAICIDQGRIDERNHQVRQMSTIFREAQTVIVWPGLFDLDEGDDLTAITSGSLEYISGQDESILSLKPHEGKPQSATPASLLPDNVLPEFLTKPEDSSTGEGDDAESAGSNFSSENSFKSLIVILSQSNYWQRQWIIQEIFLANNPRLFIASQFIPFWVLAQAYQKGIIPEKVDLDERKRNLMYGGSNYAKKTSRLELFFQKGRHGHKSMGLGRCMELSQRTACFDRRDRIYSMTGMCADLAGLPVDYRTDEGGLLLNVCCHVQPSTLWELISLVSNLTIAIDANLSILCNQHLVSYLKHKPSRAIAQSAAYTNTDATKHKTNRPPSGEELPSYDSLHGGVTLTNQTPMPELGILLLAKHASDLHQCENCSSLRRDARDFEIHWGSSHRLGQYELTLMSRRDAMARNIFFGKEKAKVHHPHLFTWHEMELAGQKPAKAW